MKILYIFLLLFVISNVNSQRRTTVKSETSEIEQPHTQPRGRGRSRFTATSEYAQISEPTKAPSDPTSRRLTSRKRVTETTERRSTKPTERPIKTSYEVDEVINESPIDSFKRQSKPRVLTESHYESIHAPKRKLIDPIQAINETPAPSLALEELFRAVESSTSNAPITDPSFVQPETTNDIAGSEDVADTTFKNNPSDYSNETSKSNEITREFTKSSAITTSKPTESRRSQNGARRNSLRTRTNPADIEETASQPTRTRTRTRPTRRPEDTSSSEGQAVTSRTTRVNRNSRRRSESATQQAEASKKGPSVFVAEETQEISRIRPGRRIGQASPEKVTIDLPSGRSKDFSRKRTATPATTTTTTEKVEEDARRRTSSRLQSRNPAPSPNSYRPRTRSRDVVPTINEFPLPTASTKGRFRARDFPPIIDEQKLEVLPLFEAESKTVRPVVKPRPASRSRTRSIDHSQENIQTSATENDLKFTPNANEIPKFSVSRTQTVNVETRTETSVKRKIGTRQPIVKESVIAEVSEVTSKRTVTRRKHYEGVKAGKTKADRPKITVSQTVTSSRGKKKSEVNLAEVKKPGGTSEEVDESDNYPEPFKALIQAKKNKKESRPSSRPQSLVPTITSIVTTTTAPTTSVSSTTTNKEDEILDNEVDPRPSTTSTTPKPSTRPSRKRFSLTTKYPVPQSTTTTTKRPTFPSRKSSKVVRSTAQPTITTTSPKEHRFHAKFSSTLSPFVRSEGPVIGGRGTVSPRGLYSSRKVKEDKLDLKEKSRKGFVESAVQSTQVPKFSSQKKNSRFSSKYRGDTSVRGSVSRSTTNAPAYIPTIPTAAYVPTIPTVAPPRRTVNSGVGSKDADLGLEIISFDDPVNTVPSANLINEEFISSSTENALNNPVSLVKEATTEKPVSIIERIINSITAMTTTVPSDTSKQTSTASTTESSSAILKLAPKKSTKPDQTKLDATSQTYPIGTVTFTTEKPTTIIERILSSLSAIQATDDTNSNQVGKDFNTISSPPTTPVSKVTKSSTSRITLPAQISTSINPLSVLDEISPDQVLQKRTIGKLLAILNGLVSTTEPPQKLVVVTPKTSNFVTGADAAVSSSTATSSASPSFSTTTSAPTATATTEAPTVPTSPDTPNPLPLTDALGTTVSEMTPGPQLFTSPLNLPQSSQVGTTMPEISQTNPPIVEGRLAQTTLTPQLQTATTPATPPTTQITTTFKATEASGGSTPTEASVQLVTQTPSDMVASTQTEATVPTMVPSTTSNSDTTPRQSNSNTAALPLSLDDEVTSSLTDSTTSNTFPTTTEAGITGTTNIETLITYLSTIPTLPNFEVSPGSVSVFSANDISNLITTDDFSTVTIAGRSNFEITATTDSTTTESGTTEGITDPIVTTEITEMATAVEGSTVSNDGTTEGVTETPQAGTTNSEQRISEKSPAQSTTTLEPTTQSGTAPATAVQDSTTPQAATGQANALSVDQNTVPSVEANALSLDNVNNTSTTPDPIASNDQGSTTSTTSTTPSQSTVGSTSTTAPQTESGTTATNNAESSTVSESSLSTVDSTTVGQITNVATTTPSSPVPSTPSSSTTTPGTTSESSASPDPTLPALSELLNGRTLEALNSIINVTNTNTNSNTNYKTLQVNQYNQVLNIQDLLKQNSKPNENVVFRWKPITRPTSEGLNKIENSTESTTAGPTLTTEAADLTMPPITETTTFMTVTPSATTSMAPQNEQTEVRLPNPLSNAIPESATPTQVENSSPSTMQPTTTSRPTTSATQPSTTQIPTSEAATTTRVVSSTTPRITSTPVAVLSTTTVSSTFPTVTFFPTFPTFITTLFPNLLRGTTPPPIATTTTTARVPTAATESETIAISASTSQPTSVVPPVRGRLRFIETTTGTPITTIRRIRTTTVPPTTITRIRKTTTTTPMTTRTTTTPTTTTTLATTTTTATTTSTTTTTTAAPTTTTTSATTTTTPTTTTTIATTTTRPPTTRPTSAAVAEVVSRRSVQLTAASSTVVPLSVAASSSTVTPKLKQLTEQQKKDLETLAQLEKEQAALLQQLSFLTSLNFGGNRNGRNKESSNLANRVIQLAVDRDKSTTSTTSTTTKPPPQNIQDQLPPIEDANKKSTPSIEDVLKQYNLDGLDIATPSSSAAPLPYGNSNDAILAALLKEQGINPPTPKSLADQIKQAGVFEETTTTRRPRPRPTTQRPPGRLMQGLNWLLNVLAPPPQTPTRKPKPVKPKKPPVEQELLANSPTRLTPMVTSAPKANSLSQDDIQKLIKQLEEVQKNPKNTAALDFSHIKSLQNLINSDGAVEVASNGQHGATSRVTTTEKSTTRKRKERPTTTLPPTISNSLEEEDDEEVEVTTARPRLPPLRLRPVPGVDDTNSDPFIRGNLITAAVNVTRAISGFLGTALQGAAQGFQSLLGSGSRLAQASSARPG